MNFTASLPSPVSMFSLMATMPMSRCANSAWMRTPSSKFRLNWSGKPPQWCRRLDPGRQILPAGTLRDVTAGHVGEDQLVRMTWSDCGRSWVSRFLESSSDLPTRVFNNSFCSTTASSLVDWRLLPQTHASFLCDGGPGDLRRRPSHATLDRSLGVDIQGKGE